MVVLVDFSNVLFNPQKGELESDVVSLLLELRKNNLRIFLFTNLQSKILESYDNELHFIQYFDGVIDGDKFLKPSPKAFGKLEEITDSLFGNMILIDDSLENIKAAQSFGIEGIVYEGIDKLKERLKDFINLI